MTEKAINIEQCNSNLLFMTGKDKLVAVGPLSSQGSKLETASCELLTTPPPHRLHSFSAQVRRVNIPRSAPPIDSRKEKERGTIHGVPSPLHANIYNLSYHVIMKGTADE